jgi:hypothetical protein
VCLAAAPRVAASEWHFTPFVGLTFKGNTTLIDPELASGDKHAALGGTVSLLSDGVFGGEGVFEIVPGFFQGRPDRHDSAGDPIQSDLVESSRVTALMGNVVLAVPRRYTEYFLRPFVSGGFGLLRARQTPATPANVKVLALEANFAGFNIGGGAVGFFSQNTGVRFDLRYFSTLHATEHESDPPITLGDPVHLRYMTLSVGLVIRR